MKLLGCSRCLSAEGPGQRRRPAQPEVTDPLVVTKRPARLVQPAAAAQPSPAGKRRLPGLLRALNPWRRDRPAKSVRVLEPQPSRRRLRYRPAHTRTQRLIRMYEERAGHDTSLESHQNFRNKLNTLDFRRMNTVALAPPRPAAEAEPEQRAATQLCKYHRKTLLEDFLRERGNIERAMAELLSGTDPGTRALNRQPGRRPRAPSCDTEIKLCLDPGTKVDDFYVEKTTTLYRDKTVEDKALVLKLAARDQHDDTHDAVGMTPHDRQLVIRDFAQLKL